MTEPGSRALRWQVLGGNNQHRIGMNAGVCLYDETDADGRTKTTTLLFDAGTLAGDPRLPEAAALAECDIVIPDIAQFLAKPGDDAHRPARLLDAIFLTHNHSDHLGALPFLALLGYRLPPVYATPYTAKRLEQECANAGLDPKEWPRIYTIAPGAPVREGAVDVSAFWVSHSTPQSVGFLVETPEGNILVPGDFKMDQTVLLGPAFDPAQFGRIAGKGIDLMLLDSTGADRDIAPVTEGEVRDTLRDLMTLHPGKRFIIAVMSGFEENLASVAQVAAEYGRKLWLAGWSHEQTVSALQQTGITLADAIGRKLDIRMLTAGKAARDLAEAEAGASVVVVTGAQGAPNTVLPRAVDGHNPSLVLDREKDIIVFCAPSIPGQEPYRERLLAALRHGGYNFLTRQDAPLYSQAHARLPELIDMAKMARAKTVAPGHGDRRLRKACAEAMRQLGENVVEAENGDTIRVTKQGCRIENAPDAGKPTLTGFKTLQGTSWFDRDYHMVTATAGEGTVKKPPPHFRRKPRIFI